jgi:hypothetical protein
LKPFYSTFKELVLVQPSVVLALAQMAQGQRLALVQPLRLIHNPLCRHLPLCRRGIVPRTRDLGDRHTLPVFLAQLLHMQCIPCKHRRALGLRDMCSRIQLASHRPHWS